MNKSLRCLAALTCGSVLALALILAVPSASRAADSAMPADKARCVVCGMFVAKYANWLARIELASGGPLFFDGVKDLMAFHFSPESYGHKKDSITSIWVKDYYTLAWIPANQAHFVVGSDVHGPMGHEFVPFATAEAAASFLKDHQGREVLRFGQITQAMVESMRSGHTMK